MKLKTIIVILVVAVISVLVVNRIRENSKLRSSAKNNATSATAITVNGALITPQKFQNQLSLSGSIEANEQVEIRSEVSGIVQEIYFEEGSYVNKGQLLLKVNDLELRAQLAQAKTRQELATENERRARLLLEKEAISQEEYDVANAELKSAQAQTQLIQAQIAKTSITAPFSGKIGLRSISPGTYVTPANLIAKLVNSGKVKISFSVPEKYANALAKDSEIEFTTAGSSENYAARVYAVEPEVNPNTRTLQLRAIADNNQGKLIPGTFANILLALEVIPDALLIPTEAVIPIQNGKKVFVAEDGKAKEVVIETSTRTDKDILVTSGIKPGDTVLTTGIMTLRNGTPVIVNLVNKS